MSASMNAFIYDTFFKLMASHAVTLDAEKAERAELRLHRKRLKQFISELGWNSSAEVSGLLTANEALTVCRLMVSSW